MAKAIPIAGLISLSTGGGRSLPLVCFFAMVENLMQMIVLGYRYRYWPANT
jgi:hypothetical protein